MNLPKIFACQKHSTLSGWSRKGQAALKMSMTENMKIFGQIQRG